MGLASWPPADVIESLASADHSSVTVIFEPNWTGHRMTYASLLAEEALREGKEVVLASTTETWSSREFETQFSHLLERIRIVDLGPWVTIDRVVPYLRWVARRIRYLSEQACVDRLLVLESDKCLIVLVLCVRRAKKVSALVMRSPQFSVGLSRRFALSAVKAMAIRLGRCRGMNVRVLKPALPVAIAGADSWSVYDPVPIRSVAAADLSDLKRRQGLDPSRRWVGVFGHIAPGKGVQFLLEAMADLRVAEWGLLIAGKISAESEHTLTQSLESLQSRGLVVEVRDGYLAEDVFEDLIRCVDVVPLTYLRDGPSGIFGKAVGLGVPVVVAGLPQLSSHVQHHRLGEVVPREVTRVAAAVESVSKSSASERAVRPMMGAREFYAGLVLGR